jgi:hypothetical protein
LTRSGLVLCVLALLGLLVVIAFITFGSPPLTVPDTDSSRRDAERERPREDRPDRLASEKVSPDPEGPREIPFPTDRLGEVTGVVVGPDGQPLLGVEVYASAPDAESVSRPELKAWVRSGEDGRFRLVHPPGRIDILAWKSGLVPGLVRDMEIRAGAASDAGTLKLQAGTTLAGRVVDPKGAGVADVEVVAFRDAALTDPDILPAREGLSRFGGTALTDEEGDFRIGGLSPDPLVVAARGLGIRMEGEPVPATPGVMAVRIVVVRLRLATGLVLADEDGRGIEAATVRLEFAPPAGGGGAQIVTTFSDGRFAFDLSDPRLSAEGMKFHLRIAAEGYEERSIENLSAEDLAPEAKLRVPLLKAAPQEPGRLRGRVLYDTGAPFHGSMTLSFSPEGKAGQVERIETDEDGNFLIEGVPPGEYRLRSAPHRSNILRETGQRLVITPGGEENTEFTLIRGGDVALQVRGPGGDPVEGTIVSVLDGAGEVMDTLLRISAPGYEDQTVTATVQKDSSVPVTVHLRER